MNTKKEIYITTDTHFNHEKMFKYCNRPTDYEEKLRTAFMALSEEDTLIHLGDVCMGKDAEVHKVNIAPIKAKKILVRGNHDHKTNSWYLDHGWDFVCRSFYDKYFGLKILFTHEPRAWDGLFEVNIHGHLHDLSHRPDEVGNSMNHLMSLEREGYIPIPLRSIVERIRGNT